MAADAAKTLFVSEGSVCVHGPSFYNLQTGEIFLLWEYPRSLYHMIL